MTKNPDETIETDEATDANNIKDRLPDDIEDRLTKKAFSPGSLRKLLRDTYYMGPISIGTGGYRTAIAGGGEAGTGMRRPSGCLYNFPRSWRYAALERALNLGLITNCGTNFVTTERGAATLFEIDICPDCGDQREPMIESTYHVGNPNTEGHMENHRLITRCPECGDNGYSDNVSGRGYKEYERDEDRIEAVESALADFPDARSYGLDRPVDKDAIHQTPGVDETATEDLLEEVIEAHEATTPADVFASLEEDQWERAVVTISSGGENFLFEGTDEALIVKQTDEKGDVHFSVTDDGRLRAEMSYEVAVEQRAKDNIKTIVGTVKKHEWTGEEWRIEPEALPVVIGKLTYAGCAQYSEDPAFAVTATPEAIDIVPVPVFGINSDGQLVEN